MSVPERPAGSRALKAAAAATLAVTVYYAVFFHGPLPDHRWIVGWNDIVLHIGAFTVLTGLTLPQFGNQRALLGGLVLLAAGLEAIQILEPVRTASLSDFAASAGGVGLGWLLVSGLRKALGRFRPVHPSPSSNRSA
jgi:hypothetical protein